MINTTLDLNKPGKQQGFLQVPYSHNLGGWANVMIPITIVARGKGPTVLVLGGNHGDEYQGQIAIMKLARELTSEKVSPRPRAKSRANPTRHPKSNFPADQSGCQAVGSTRFENCVMGFRLRR